MENTHRTDPLQVILHFLSSEILATLLGALQECFLGTLLGILSRSLGIFLFHLLPHKIQLMHPNLLR